MRNSFPLIAGSLLILSSLLCAQQPARPDPFADLLFSPDLILARQNAIGLSDAQKNYLHAEMAESQAHFTDMQWQLQSAIEELTGLLRQPKADEAQVVAQMDKVLAAEREIKLAQIALLVRIKNNLTPEQQRRLRTMRSESK
jgi:Spy/CpxP family protein refolding chaperone